MKKSKNRLLVIGGVIIALILAFVGYFKLDGAKDQYCLAQTHMQFPITTPMDGDKWDFYTGCFDKLSFKDSIKLLMGDQSAELKKATEVSALLAVMEKNPNKDSQEYAEARQEFCFLTARSATEQEKAVANIRQFLGMPDIPVEFVCSRFNNKLDNSGTDYNSPASETYEAARFSFIVDPNTNYIVETGEAERRWGTKADGTRWFENMPEYDDTPIYTTPEAIKPVAEAFMIKNKDIFGVDITKMTYQFEGRKVGNFFVKWIDKSKPHTNDNVECGDVDQKREGAYQNDQGVWCLKSTYTRYPTVSMTIMQSGQVAVYDNDGWDLEKQ